MTQPQQKDSAIRAPAEAQADARGDEEAQSLLAEGIRKFEAGDLIGAHESFGAAHARAMNDPFLMSWHGLSLVLVDHNSNLGALYCDEALRRAGTDADLLLNQARVYLALGQRERAVRAVQRGLICAPDHPGLRLAHASLGWRRKPVIPVLGRNHALNRLLGKLRHRLAGRSGGAEGELAAARLGLRSPEEGGEPPQAPPASQATKDQQEG
jgi:hypothetical protein